MEVEVAAMAETLKRLQLLQTGDGAAPVAAATGSSSTSSTSKTSKKSSSKTPPAPPTPPAFAQCMSALKAHADSALALATAAKEACEKSLRP